MARRSLILAVAGLVALAPACADRDPELSTGPEAADESPAPEGGAPAPVEGAGAATASFMAQVAQNTVEAPAFEFTMTMDVEGMPEIGSGTVMTAEGAFSQDGQRGRMTMDMSGMFDAMGSQGLGDMGELGGMLEGFAEPWEIIVDGETAYMKGGFLAAMLGAGDGWFALEGDAGGLDPTGGTADPTELLRALEGIGAGTTVTEVGTEDIDGVPTTHYRVDLDVAELATAFGELGAGAPGDVGAFGFDVWVDEQAELVRRLQVSAQLPVTGSEAPGSMVMTIDMTPLDEPVSIEVPDPSEVTDAGDLGLGGLGGLGGIGQGG